VGLKRDNFVATIVATIVETISGGRGAPLRLGRLLLTLRLALLFVPSGAGAATTAATATQELHVLADYLELAALLA
jgi:hypothetical protein